MNVNNKAFLFVALLFQGAYSGSVYAITRQDFLKLTGITFLSTAIMNTVAWFKKADSNETKQEKNQSKEAEFEKKLEKEEIINELKSNFYYNVEQGVKYKIALSGKMLGDEKVQALKTLNLFDAALDQKQFAPIFKDSKKYLLYEFALDTSGDFTKENIFSAKNKKYQQKKEIKSDSKGHLFTMKIAPTSPDKLFCEISYSQEAERQELTPPVYSYTFQDVVFGTTFESFDFKNENKNLPANIKEAMKAAYLGVDFKQNEYDRVVCLNKDGAVGIAHLSSKKLTLHGHESLEKMKSCQSCNLIAISLGYTDQDPRFKNQEKPKTVTIGRTEVINNAQLTTGDIMRIIHNED